MYSCMLASFETMSLYPFSWEKNNTSRIR